RAEVPKDIKPGARQQWEQLNRQMEQYTRLRPPQLPVAMTLTDIGPVSPATYLLKRGNWRQRGPEVAPGFLSAIDDRTADLTPPNPNARSTGRRDRPA